MKTIIISDIDSEKGSIIPFGLNIGKHTETTVDIIHIIDSRTVQGVQSQYADSQTITPGNKLTHKAIVEREKDKACRDLDKLISKEGSRLNYPLKINISVEEMNLESLRQKLEDDYPGSLVVTSSAPDGTIFQEMNEILGFIRDTKLPVVTVPADVEFALPESIALIIDLSAKPTDGLAQLSKWLAPFKTPLDFIGIANQSELHAMDENMNSWKQKMDTHTSFPGIKNIKVATGDNYYEALKDQVSKSNSAWIAIPRRHNWDKGLQLFHGKNLGKIIASENKPLLLY